MQEKERDHAKLKLDTQFGQGATVQREDLHGELFRTAHESLSKIGAALNPVPGEALEYKGSAAVHIYQSKNLGQIFFASQVDTLGKTNEVVASKALIDLKNRAMEHYGRRGMRKRSGF